MTLSNLSCFATLLVAVLLFCKPARAIGAPTSHSQVLVELPNGVKNIVIDVGASHDPMVPRAEHTDTHVLAFEPLPTVQQQVPTHPQLSLLPAAVSDKSGIATIYEYGDPVAAQASSLAKASVGTGLRHTGNAYIVPTVSLSDILESIPRDVDIRLIKTDIQGLDFQVISSVGEALRERGVERLVTEVYLENTNAYDGVHNDFCMHWKDYMKNIGYKLLGLEIGSRVLDESETSALCSHDYKQATGVKEGNAYWYLEGKEGLLPDTFVYPTLYKPDVLESMKKIWTEGYSIVQNEEL
jgi:FkbM family methyltransferase